MMTMRLLMTALVAAALAATAPAQTVPVPNASFEDGTDAPVGWKIEGGQGRWLDSGAAEGGHAVAVSAQGKGSSYWRSGTLPLAPSAVYQLSFSARRMEGEGKAMAGPVFANRDIGDVPEAWKRYDSIFVTPTGLTPDRSFLRLGQWEIRGTVAYDAVELVRAVPVYVRSGGLELGAGERVLGNEYTFAAPFHGASASHSRPLDHYTCGYNTDRWTFAAGEEVVYRHRLGDRRQTAAAVQVGVPYYVAGELAVEASADGKAWQPLGTIGKMESRTLPVPASLLPAAEVWVRLRAQPVAAAAGEKKSSRASLQVGHYGYQATLDGEPARAVGVTRFVAVKELDPRLDVQIEDLGEMMPGENTLRLAVTNKSPAPLNFSFSTTVSETTLLSQERFGHTFGPYPPLIKKADISLPYRVPCTGPMTLEFSLGPVGEPRAWTRASVAAPTPAKAPPLFRASVAFDVPELHNASYGEKLPASSEAVGLWWASSGWKVSRRRGVPTETGKAVVISAARNEAEAAQVVLRPAAALKGLTVRAAALAGPGGGMIPAENVEVLRVRYVFTAHPTDRTGAVDEWPDPLPPLKAPLDLEAGRNQPLWVRVKVPADAKPGTYAGKLRLSADGYAADVPLHVRVYDFALPDRMTCQTAFGFSPWNVWKYQKLDKDEDRRAVLEKYWADFAAHHIAPYDPAPFDHFKVTWPKGSQKPKTGDAPPFAPARFVPAIDWTAWDAAMMRAVDVHHFNTFRIAMQGMGGGTFHDRHEPQLLGWPEGTPEYQAAFTSYAKAVESHLKEKGWLDEAFVYWFDEPDPKDYAFVMNGFRKLKESAPGLRRMLTEQVEPGLVGGPNLWCPVSHDYNHERAEERRRAGDRFWWYVCCGPKAPHAGLFLDHPGVEMRVWLWQTWQRGIDGILVWETNYWTSTAAYPDAKSPQNPYEDPMSWVSGYSQAKGTKSPWGNGDGRFIYPPEVAAAASPPGPVLDGPVGSQRWEMLRDGIEDYEYFVILRRLLAEKGASLSEAERKAFAALLTVPEDVAKDMTTFTKDPAPLERRREAVARAIETVGRR